MTIWTNVEPIKATRTPADVAALTADRVGSLEARVHALAARYDDLIAVLRVQRVQLDAHQAAIVRLARGTAGSATGSGRDWVEGLPQARVGSAVEKCIRMHFLSVYPRRVWGRRAAEVVENVTNWLQMFTPGACGVGDHTPSTGQQSSE